MADSTKKRQRRSFDGGLWSDEELAVAIDSYLYMLQLELTGVPFSVAEFTNTLLSGPLHKRNDAAFRYRMRNISDVLYGLNLSTLKNFTPAPRVGTNVRKKIETILDSRLRTIKLLKLSRPYKKETQDDLIKRLDDLQKKLAVHEKERPPGIGHNNPPEPIDDTGSNAINIRQSIAAIKEQLSSDAPDIVRINKERSLIVSFGLKVAIEAGRLAKVFTTAAAKTAGHAFGGYLVAEATGLVPDIISAMQSVTHYIQGLV